MKNNNAQEEPLSGSSRNNANSGTMSPNNVSKNRGKKKISFANPRRN